MLNHLGTSTLNSQSIMTPDDSVSWCGQGHER